jgi:ubiquinone biosynthesis protein UbiJ
MSTPPLISPFEALLNRSVAASTPARLRMGELNGRSFALQLMGPTTATLLRLRIAVCDTQLKVSIDDEPADALVTGTPFALIRLLTGQRNNQVGTSGITITGDAEIAQAFDKLLQHAKPDVEAELARIIGDMPAYYVSRFTREGVTWLQRTTNALSRNISEYLTEESRDLVSEAELDVWLTAVDHIREDVDRAAARLELLEKRYAHRTPNA